MPKRYFILFFAPIIPAGVVANYCMFKDIEFIPRSKQKEQGK